MHACSLAIFILVASLERKIYAWEKVRRAWYRSLHLCTGIAHGTTPYSSHLPSHCQRLVGKCPPRIRDVPQHIKMGCRALRLLDVSACRVRHRICGSFILEPDSSMLWPSPTAGVLYENISQMLPTGLCVCRFCTHQSEQGSVRIDVINAKPARSCERAKVPARGVGC